MDRASSPGFTVSVDKDELISTSSPSFKSTIVAMVVTILLSLFLRFYMARQNAFRDRLSAARGDESVREKDEVRDEDEVWTREETDVKDLGFRYSL